MDNIIISIGLPGYMYILWLLLILMGACHEKLKKSLKIRTKNEGNSNLKCEHFFFRFFSTFFKLFFFFFARKCKHTPQKATRGVNYLRIDINCFARVVGFLRIDIDGFSIIRFIFVRIDIDLI